MTLVCDNARLDDDRLSGIRRRDAGGYQAKERDDYRDAEPGKILHELRYGELAHFKLIPHTPYYGTADATPLYLVALHAAWRATGDRTLIERHLPNAEACLTWIDKYGDRDGDGFQEYQTRSTAGYENMAWKDSGDSVMYPDGTLVHGPKALWSGIIARERAGSVVKRLMRKDMWSGWGSRRGRRDVEHPRSQGGI
jgi:glycogen debranching enzyme